MHKHIFLLINVFACVPFFGGSVKAEIIDCVNHLIPIGVSPSQAGQACAKARQPASNASSSRELYRLCRNAQIGKGKAIYYPNGQIMTSGIGKKGETWYYPNGQIMTFSAGKKGASWYYSTGQIMTFGAGKERTTWYYPHGKIMTLQGNVIPEEDRLYPCSYIE